MRKTILVLCIVSLLLPTAALAGNYKKAYCGNKEYLGNPGKKYPHLHCGKDFLTFSESAKKHLNLHDVKAGCKRAANVISDKDINAKTTEDPQAITKAVKAFMDAECKK